MSTSMVHVRVEDEVKDEAAEALKAMGLTVSGAVRAFLKRVATEKEIPFLLRVPNAESRIAIMEAKSLLKAHTTRFTSGSELLDALEKETRQR